MKLALLAGLTLAGCNACQPTPSPAPPPVLDAAPLAPPMIDAGPAPAPSPADVRIYDELVEAGCLQASSDGLQSLVEEHQLRDPSDTWLDCLYDGGAVRGCKVPYCLDDSGAAHKGLRR